MRKADNLPTYRAVGKKSGSLNILDPSGPARPVMGELYLYIHIYIFLLKRKRGVLPEDKRGVSRSAVHKAWPNGSTKYVCHILSYKGGYLVF